MAVFILIRHGENDWVGKRLAGRTPGVHLNGNGKKQAENLAEYLKNVPFKAIYSSPLERAQETAFPLSNQTGLTVQICEDLSEINFGDWQGKTIKQLRRLKLWKTVQESPQDMQFPNGETFVSAQNRLVSCLQKLSDQYEENGVIACFSHSDSIRLLVAYFLNMNLNDFQRLSIGTASISVVIYGKKFTAVPVVNYQPDLNWSSFFEKPKDKTIRKD